MENTQRFQELKKLVAPIASSYGLRKLSLFGSHARGDATLESYIDLMFAEKGQVLSLFQLAGLRLALEEKLGARVAIVAEDCLDATFLAGIREEEVALYENQPE
jgi:predicted nucleotidyltransferase